MLPFGKTNQSPEDQTRMWRLAGMGWTLVTELIAGMLFGWGLDWAFGTEKVFIIVGAIVGLLVGLSSFIRAALAENRRLEQERKNR